MGLFTKQTVISTQIDAITNLQTISQWDTIAALCETVNAKDDGAKEAAKALRKKLRVGRPQQQMNAITLIQALVDGCGSKFKAQLATAKFAEDIEAVVVADATDANVKIRLMESLEGWANTFVSDPGLAIIPHLYNSLVKSNTPRQSPHQRGGPPSPPRAPITPEQQMRQMAQDIELARNNAHMLIEAVSFADPDLEAIEENDLIKEFHSKCQSLQRGIQQYLSEITESANPNEQWLTSLLACNQELVQAFTAYNQMMERQHLNKATKASETANPLLSRNGNGLPNGQHVPTDDLLSFGDTQVAGEGAGVGNGHAYSNGHGASNGKGAAHNVPASQNAAQDPFADEPYHVGSQNDVSTAVRMGKRTDNQDKVFDASAYFRQQQEQQEQLQALKEQQRQLHLEQQQIQNSGGSSQAPSGAVPVAALP
ncbi:putative actin patch assembly and actin polymerization protein [Mortierella sp. 14UC]|nr:putative actin patch assembly and actin polymerization protein [Mortierella sp. 14UC]